MIEADVGNTNHTATEAAECAAGKRKDRRKAVKKEKRKNKRKEMAEIARREEEIRLNDPEEQRRLQAEEEQERLRAEEERRHFVEMERKILEEWDRKKALQEKEEDERRRRAEQEELLSKQNQVGHENEVDDDGWGYVEEGPSEIIWQGNEIIVKKKKIRVKKKDDQQIMKEDTYRPTSNPLPPQSEAFTDHKTAQQLLDSVAQETPNFGTEQDKAHCPFHLKTGACRFGSRCSRIHFFPDKSCTLLIKSMYNGPGLAWEQDEGLEKRYVILPVTHTDEEVERAYEEFYEDVHTEFLKFGEIINFKVCRNGSSHLRGNVYVHYKSLESAVLSYQSVNGRYFAGKQLHCEFVGLTRWRGAICGEFMKSKLKNCSRGTACNFIHCFRNPGGDYEWADWDKPPPKYWVKEMAALFGYPDESGHHRKIEQGSPRLISYSSVQSLSRKPESPSCSRNYSEDLRRSEPRRHHRGSDRKHSEIHDNEHHADISKCSSNLSPACRKRKLGSQCARSDEMNIHETDRDESMHENDLDSYHYEPSRSRRHREKQCRGAGSKGDGRIEDNRGPLNQSGTAKGKDPEQPKKMSASSTYNSDLTGDCSDGEERQSRNIHREEPPISHGSEEFEDRKRRPCIHKLKISSNWDNSDRGNGEDEHARQSYRTSDYSSKHHRKERHGAERGKSERQIPVHQEKSERKREVEYRKVIRSHGTDDERGRWEPEKGDSA